MKWYFERIMNFNSYSVLCYNAHWKEWKSMFWFILILRVKIFRTLLQFFFYGTEWRTEFLPSLKKEEHIGTMFCCSEKWRNEMTEDFWRRVMTGGQNHLNLFDRNTLLTDRASCISDGVTSYKSKGLCWLLYLHC